MRKNRLKQIWRESKPSYGIWADIGSVAAVEALAQIDPDWILLDGEHGVGLFEECFHLLQAMNGSNSTSIIRVPWNDTIAIKRSLDMGAEAIMVPYVRTAEDVRKVVAACRYPPAGTRGLGPYRASRYETDFEDYYKNANKEIIVMVQIENTEAVSNLDEIIAVPGLDSIFVGPADLSASMGLFPDMNGAAVQKVVKEILDKGNKAGLPVGYYCSTGADAKARADQGFKMMNVGNDMVFLVTTAMNELRAARGQTGKAVASSYTGI